MRMFFWGLLGVWVLLMAACGGSVIEAHIKSAQISRTALDASKAIIEQHVDDLATGIMKNPKVDVGQAELDAHQAIRMHEPLRALHNKAIAAYELWVTSLMSAYSKEENPSQMSIWYSLAMQLFTAYKDLVIEGIRLGIPLPKIDHAMKDIR